MTDHTEHVEIALTDELLGIRRRLHRHPERSFKEFETSMRLRNLLESHGITVLDNPLDTGVIGEIKGEHDGPQIGLRADIDALPVHEDSGLVFASENEGVMHACGHDIHMTSLLGAAFWLAAHRELIHGTIRLVFQPAEELGQGARAVADAGLVDGLDAMIGTHNNPELVFQPAEELGQGARAVADAGLVDGLDAMIGTHNNPDYKPGQIAVGVDPMMAGCVKFRVNLHAQGTHAGYPHRGTGPLEAMAAMVLSLQTIVSRNASPFHPLVISVTEVHGGDVWNVVPAEAGFQGTARYFHREDGDLAERRFRQVIESTAAAYDIAVDYVWDDFQRPLVSDPDLATLAMSHVPEYAQLEPIHPSMAGEDFAEYEGHTRLLFAFIGSNGSGGCADLHSPKFVALDDAVKTGAEFYANSALEVLEHLS